MAVGTVGEFLAVLERSRLLKPEQDAEVQRLAKEIADPTTLAKTLARQNILTRWQAGQLLAGRSTFFLGKYKLLELLGKGGMGSVFLGEHVMMNRRVALKIIPRHIGKDPAGLERFLAEARTIAALDHPNIVQAYSVDNEGDLYYLVMEYVEGLDLQRLVEAEGPLDCASAVDYIRQAAEGLNHAHNRKMIHCDIKPSNLIVNPHGVVKILDMGLARLAGHEQLGNGASEQDERILGSVDYMSPEQALRTSDFNHRADIYSLGCTLYYLLTGHAPFPEGTLPERILKHQSKEPQAISTKRSDVPLSLIEICKKMMAKRPADRYQTASDVSHVLASWRPGEKRVQRVLQLKKAEPVDELPGPDLLGADLSELFRKGIGVSTTAPIISRKLPPTPAEKFRAVLHPFIGTPLRTLATVSVTGLAAVVLAAAVMLPHGDNGKPMTSSNGTSSTTGNADGKASANGTSTQPADNNPSKVNEIPGATNGNKVGSNETGSTPPLPPAPPAPNTNDTIPPPKTPDIENPPPVAPQPEQPQNDQPKVDPLKDLATSVDLPEIPKAGSLNNTSEKTVSLGAVAMPSGATLQLVLFGGENALKNNDSIVIKNNAPLWKINVETPSEDENSEPSKQIEIAQLKLSDGKLQFSWIPGVTPAIADCLSNCGLLAFVQGQQKFVQLRRMRQIKPIELDLEKGPIKVSLPIEPMPDPRNLRVQITDREGAFPPNALHPSDILEISPDEKSEITIDFTEPKYQNFKVKLTAEIKGQKLDIEASAFYEIPELQPLKPFKVKEAENLLNNLTMQQARVQARFDSAAEGSQTKKAAAKTLQQLKKPIEVLQDIGTLFQQLNKQGKIHYSVFILYYNKYKVELFNTQIPVVVAVQAPDPTQPTAEKTDGEPQPPKKAPSKKKKPKT